MGFKVVIVGGSIAGLSVANMLEKFDIEYVLLEAYPRIAPQVGASIGLLPSGFRILDQLGCYEAVLDVAGKCRDIYGSVHGPDGTPVSAPTHTSTATHFVKRISYPSVFIDRQMLLQILYGNIKHKDRILTDKRVSHVDLMQNGVRARTEDGSIYEGDIIVGADGIHSVIRDEMWRLGKEQSPGCIFGISNRPPAYGKQTQHLVLGYGHAYVIVAAPGDRTYWFLFDGLPHTEYGENISKYTKADEDKLADEHRDDRITNDVTFGDLYDRKIISTLLPLEEYVFERWHYKRIITIGDSAHKIDPASGQGGNGAIESAALLTNALVRQLNLTPDGLSSDQVNDALSEVHANRYERAKRLVDGAHTLQQIVSYRFPLSRYVLAHIVPLLGKEAFVDVVTPICAEASKIEGLPVPYRPHCVPWEDELPAKPVKSILATRSVWALSSGSLGYLLSSNLSRTRVNPLIYTLIGPNAAIPYFCLSSVLFSTKSTTSRPVKSDIARSIIPGVLLGYVVPTITALIPFRNISMRRHTANVWQAFPVLTMAFTTGLAAIRRRIAGNVTRPEYEGKTDSEGNPVDPAAVESDLWIYTDDDVVPLERTHAFGLILCVAVPILTRVTSSFTSSIFNNWTQTGVSRVLPLSATASVTGAASGIIYSLYSAWELRSLGFVGTGEAMLGGVASVVSLGLAGPGAAIATVSYWRERAISSLSS
ncbi:2-polyprenyl-6-methoxyphenol hydroxylase [Geosmithia morbida]|uniref:2-polyprenyl-6-methoxyphenol hydroxylase n=1 Tax=Geosmithia morbida TaxID=1094350 RepID=A0A9P4Z2K2_9HYPO|nr:2-polyprenyl-6-methoxyphenol hydroxylase [Geosmithia morbida]KAF4126264.1 2-polyprenyl-6-methoxyphenol hydroxylase [Geosmithia morbida]